MAEKQPAFIESKASIDGRCAMTSVLFVLLDKKGKDGKGTRLHPLDCVSAPSRDEIVRYGDKSYAVSFTDDPNSNGSPEYAVVDLITNEETNTSRALVHLRYLRELG